MDDAACDVESTNDIPIIRLNLPFPDLVFASELHCNREGRIDDMDEKV